MKILKKKKKLNYKQYYTAVLQTLRCKSSLVKNEWHINGTSKRSQKDEECIIVLQSLLLQQSTNGMLVKALRLNTEISTPKVPP